MAVVSHASTDTREPMMKEKERHSKYLSISKRRSIGIAKQQGTLLRYACLFVIDIDGNLSQWNTKRHASRNNSTIRTAGT